MPSRKLEHIDGDIFVLIKRRRRRRLFQRVFLVLVVRDLALFVTTLVATPTLI